MSVLEVSVKGFDRLTFNLGDKVLGRFFQKASARINFSVILWCNYKTINSTQEFSFQV